jgi:tRNA(Ile2) C34 agmatinyltransferase TiaS
MTTSNALRCPICPGHGVPLGTLGRLRWFRCRDCGMDFHRPSRTRMARSRNSPQREGVRLG